MSDLKGFYNPNEKPGPITGSGPNFEKAQRAFKRRQERRSKVGRWRAGYNPTQYKSDGDYIDPDWYIVDMDLDLECDDATVADITGVRR